MRSFFLWLWLSLSLSPLLPQSFAADKQDHQDDHDNEAANHKDRTLQNGKFSNCGDTPANACQVTVAIVGAGWAGLTVGYALTFPRGRGSTDDFVIFETNDYYGGRSKTIQNKFKAGFPVEEGSAWLYPGSGPSQNAQWSKIPTFRTKFKDIGSMTFFKDYGSMGGLTSTEELTLVKDNYKQTFLPFAASRTDKSMGTIANEYFASPECNNFADCTQDAEPHRQIINAILEANVYLEFTGTPNDLDSSDPIDFLSKGNPSAKGNTIDYTGVAGGGVDKILQAFVAEYKMGNKILLNTQVTEINTSDSSRVLLVAGGQYFSAKAVAVTVSLGLLKNDDITFIPPLSTSKQNAIADLGYGVLNKILLYWEQRPSWWPDGQVDMVLVTGADASSDKITWFFNEQSQGQGNANYYSLAGFVAGDFAIAIESMAENDVVAMAVANLKKMFPTAAVSNPDKSLVTKWNNNPCTRGSYSYNKHGVDNDAARQALATPEGRLFFAGEANDVVWYATTAGAFISGEYTADKIRDFLSW